MIKNLCASEILSNSRTTFTFDMFAPVARFRVELCGNKLRICLEGCQALFRRLWGCDHRVSLHHGNIRCLLGYNPVDNFVERTRQCDEARVLLLMLTDTSDSFDGLVVDSGRPIALKDIDMRCGGERQARACRAHVANKHATKWI